MRRQLNKPNWFQPVSVYVKGVVDPLDEFEIQQVWDGSLAGHRRLRRQCLEVIEGMRDTTSLEYIMWSPVVTGGMRIPLADKQHIDVR